MDCTDCSNGPLSAVCSWRALRCAFSPSSMDCSDCSCGPLTLAHCTGPLSTGCNDCGGSEYCARAWPPDAASTSGVASARTSTTLRAAVKLSSIDCSDCSRGPSSAAGGARPPGMDCSESACDTLSDDARLHSDCCGGAPCTCGAGAVSTIVLLAVSSDCMCGVVRAVVKLSSIDCRHCSCEAPMLSVAVSPSSMDCKDCRCALSTLPDDAKSSSIDCSEGS